MTATQLKAEYERRIGGYFFDQKTMRFFGDTMKNFGVCSGKVDGKAVWVLYRRKAVKHGLNKSHYFDQTTYAEVVKAS